MTPSMKYKQLRSRAREIDAEIERLTEEIAVIEDQLYDIENFDLSRHELERVKNEEE